MTSKCIVVTGPMGSGKSAVCRAAKRAGYRTADADRIAKRYRESPSFARWVRRVLGTPEVPGNIADHFFRDASLHAAIESHLHPKVYAHLAGMASAGGELIAEVPLYFESLDSARRAGFFPDAVVWVETQDALRQARLKARGMEPGDIQKRESFFLPAEEKRGRSQVVVCNDGDLEALQQKVEDVLCALLKK